METEPSLLAGLAAEEEVRRLRDQLRLVFDLAPIPKAILGFDGQFEQVNDAMCSLLGYSRTELLERSMPSISLPDDLPANIELQQALLEGAIPNFQMDKRYVRSDGEMVWVSLSVRVIESMTGEKRMLGQMLDITERKRLEQRMAYEAGHDALTGLPNRRLMVSLIDDALARLDGSGQRSVAVLFCDLDQFKLYNDTFGHTTGDRLLVAVADRLRSALGPDAQLGRFGGDELLLVCPDLSGAEEALVVAEQIQAAFLSPLLVRGQRCYVTASTGIAVTEDRDQVADDLIRDADTAMYEAKANGRNGVRIFDHSLRAASRDRLAMESELHAALEQGQISAHFQPVMDMVDGSIVGFEALARWNHPTRGPISPNQFVPVAEATGLIGWLGDEMVDQAVAFASRFDDLYVAVNVSPAQFGDDHLAERIGQVLVRHGVTPDRLVVEITEHGVIRDSALGIGQLQRLRHAGIRVFIDDFGTGHSSLTQLTQLPLDGVKIDQSFIRDRDDRRLAVIDTVIELGHRLGLTVVAEGVEEQADAAVLVAAGCRLAQGFLYGPALPADEAAGFRLSSPIRSDSRDSGRA